MSSDDSALAELQQLTVKIILPIGVDVSMLLNSHGAPPLSENESRFTPGEPIKPSEFPGAGIFHFYAMTSKQSA